MFQIQLWNYEFILTCFRDKSEAVESALEKVSLSEVQSSENVEDLSEGDDESDFSDFFDDDDDAYIDSYDDWNESVASHGMTGEQTNASHPNKQVLSLKKSHFEP